MSRNRYHVAILQTAFLGDALLSIPLAKTLKSRNHYVTFICRTEFVELFRSLAIFDSVLGVKKSDSESYRQVRDTLKKSAGSDLSLILISPHESHRSKFFSMSLRALGVAVRTIGYSDRRFNFGLSRWSYSGRVVRSMNLPEALRQMQLLTDEVFDFRDEVAQSIEEFRRTQEMSGGRRADGSLLPVPVWASMRVKVRDETSVTDDPGGAVVTDDPGEVGGGFRRGPKSVVLAPGSVWPTKQWTRDGFANIGRRFLREGYQVFVTGAASEVEVCDSISKDIGGDSVSLAGKISLLETVRRVAQADVAVVNDSGTMHIAALVGTPSVAIFGPTVLDFGYRPWSNVGHVVEPMAALSCRPCGLHGSLRCPIGTHECMTGTGADVVWAKIQEALSAP